MNPLCTRTSRNIGDNMRNWILLALITVLSSGCLSSQIVPKESLLQSMRTISIVPIESPPLLLTPRTEEDRATIIAMIRSAAAPTTASAPMGAGPGASLAQLAAPFTFAPSVGLRSGAAVVVVIGGMSMLFEAASSGKEISEEAGEVMIDHPSERWLPSIEYAKTAVLALQQRGYHEVRMIDGYASLPVADRSITWHMENWLAPIRRWYNSNVSKVDYAPLGSVKADVILEVGVMNYEYAFERLFLQVWVKLIDPTTKQVLGRARNFEQSTAQPLALLLQNNAEGMKRLALEIGNRSLAKCLADVGLASSSD